MYYSDLPETQAFASPNARGSITPECRRRTGASARADRRPRPTIGRTPARGACLHHHTAIGCLPWTEKKRPRNQHPHVKQSRPGAAGSNDDPCAAAGGAGVPHHPLARGRPGAAGGARPTHWAAGSMEGLGLEAIQEVAGGGATPPPPREEHSEQQPVTPRSLEKDQVRLAQF